ncbi:MAG: cation-translocating P-type ATPase [Candidatus Bathyarchaeota archaeon]|jgi:Ca2+-transporting ATPase|nr:cation-translocating P-type ATPase [Candidatus Bathyarchaeota archaeon]
MQPVDVGSISGLSNREAIQRLEQDGPNELPSAEGRSVLRIGIEILREPMFLLLVASGSIYFILGDFQEGIMLMSFVAVIIGITIYQQQKAENALRALRNLSSPRAHVIRDGERKRISGREVVCEDVLVLSEGDRVPADAILLSSSNLMIDESLLTGESLPVRKVQWDGGTLADRPGGDDQPLVYSGTLVVQGHAVAKVRATGATTEIGKIGKSLQTSYREESRLEKDTERLVRTTAIIGLSLCAIVVIAYGLIRSDWIHGFLAGITLAMAILPEEFPVVLTVFLALGAWRLSRNNVLTRNAPAIEALGAATVLCVDKTGTLTENKMSVYVFFSNGQTYYPHSTKASPIPEPFHELVEFSILACKRDPFNPMEKALIRFGEIDLVGTAHLHGDWELLQEYPLSQQLLVMSNVWRSRDGAEYIIAAKGAPEDIADLCHFGEVDMKELSLQVNTMAEKGLRVLGVARAYFRRTELPEEQHDFTFKFLGLVGFADPIRPKVADAISECYTAGIRVVMVTGDYPATAQSIARQVGMKSVDEYITGDELDALSDAELGLRVRNVNIFARIVPEQKLRIVNALKANHETVAMTGDGVNDAPALKSANVGIAMGNTGTDVAREASSLVLLDDNFAFIVAAVRTGRRIFDNLKKATAYILSIHVPIAGMSLVPVLFGWPLVLFPVHVVFLELIIDPACSVVFEEEPEEANIMKKPPRKLNESLYNMRTIVLSLLQGCVLLLVLLVVFSGTIALGSGELKARAMTFTTLVIANLGLMLTNRSWLRTIPATLRSPNRALWWVVGGAVLFLGLVLYVPILQELFSFSFLHPFDLLVCLGAGGTSVLWFEILKLRSRRQDLKYSASLPRLS